MKVSHGEGRAGHTGPELWLYLREEMRQALAGESMGRVLSREMDCIGSADALVACGRQHRGHCNGEMVTGFPRSKTSARTEVSHAKIGRSRCWPCPAGKVRAANPDGRRLR